MKNNKNFWNDDEMFPLLLQYKSFWDLKEPKKAKLMVPPQLRDAVWEQIHPQLRKIAFAAASKVNPVLNNRDTVESAMLHLHHVIVHNFNEERKKSYGYFYTCARAFFIEFLRGTGRGRIGGQIGKKTQIRKEVLVPREMTKNEIIKQMNEETSYEWSYGKVIKRKADTPEDKKRVSLYRTDRELVQWEDEYEDIPEEAEWSWGSLADQIDWDILSEYIPDTTSSVYTKKVAYVLLDVIRMLVENEVGKSIGVLLTYQMTRARFKHTLTNHQLWLARDVLRQAFVFYAEDELA